MASLHSPLWGMSVLASSLLAITIAISSATSAERDVAGKYFIFFQPDSAQITPAAKVIVDKAAEDAKRASNGRIVVKGFAAPEEDDGARLAAHRAAAIAAAIGAQGAPPDELKTERATSDLVVAALTPEMDRRVEIVVESAPPSYSAFRSGSAPDYR